MLPIMKQRNCSTFKKKNAQEWQSQSKIGFVFFVISPSPKKCFDVE